MGAGQVEVALARAGVANGGSDRARKGSFGGGCWEIREDKGRKGLGTAAFTSFARPVNPRCARE